MICNMLWLQYYPVGFCTDQSDAKQAAQYFYLTLGLFGSFWDVNMNEKKQTTEKEFKDILGELLQLF